MQLVSSPWPATHFGVWSAGQAMRQGLQAPTAGTEHDGMVRAARRPPQEASMTLIRHISRIFCSMVISLSSVTAGGKPAMC